MPELIRDRAQLAKMDVKELKAMARAWNMPCWSTMGNSKTMLIELIVRF